MGPEKLGETHCALITCTAQAVILELIGNLALVGMT
jgi:hypothetical protein